MNKTARITGFLYLIIVIGGVFAEMFVRSQLVDYNNAIDTAKNIQESQGLFRFGFSLELFIFVCDAAVTVLLYQILKPINKGLSLFAASFRLVTVAILGANLLYNFIPILLLNESAYLAPFNSEQLGALSLLYMKAHGFGYSLALVFFSVHCVVIGYLISKSTYIPKLIGILLIIAGLCYFINSYTAFLFPAISSKIFPAILIPALIAELSLSLWLLIKGVKTAKIKGES